MSNLKDELIKLGNNKPELRDHIRPLLSSLQKIAGRVPDLAKEHAEKVENLVRERGYP